LRPIWGILWLNYPYTLSMKQPEYKEGQEALENFKSLATAILQAPGEKEKEADQEVSPAKKF